jgi:hypothetical protein
MNVEVLLFDDAIKAAAGRNKPHLLLGNGFSIACRPDIFRYDKLFAQANFTNLSPSAQAAFVALNTTDFERVIRALRSTAALSALYGAGTAATEAMLRDAAALKELLVQTIADSHPAQPSEISDDEYAACRAFLANFKDTYTFNYDLLLYWTHMHAAVAEVTESDDGFRTSKNDVESGKTFDYVVWESGTSYQQNMFFLHGALHFFDSGAEIQKYTWNRTGIRLIDQVRDALSKDLFPVFVAEGTSDEKLERIRHSDYLAKAYRSFEAIQGCLFIYGHSLAENDEHFLKLIERGKLEKVFVGLFGDTSSPENQKIIARAQALAIRRGKRNPLEVRFYDSASAGVWR